MRGISKYPDRSPRADLRPANPSGTQILRTSALFMHIAFAAAVFCLSATVTYFMARVVRVMDVPTSRSSHERPVPKSGGLAIVIAFVVGSFAIYFFARYARIEDRYFWSYFVCAIALALVSFI